MTLLALILSLGHSIEYGAQPVPIPVNDLLPDPYRYMDGERLANRMTGELLHLKMDQKTLTEHDPVAFKNLKLMGGMPLDLSGSPESFNRERELYRWLMKQPKWSVYPHHLIRQAIQISGGNVEKGLISAWGVLTHKVRDVQNRNQLEHQKRLADITGEIDSQVPNKKGEPITMRGDNISAWYHFIGTAYDAFTNANGAYSNQIPLPPCDRPNLIRNTANQALRVTNLKIWTEDTVFGWKIVDRKKRTVIDQAGAKFGAKLYENLHQYPTLEEWHGDRESQNTTYLYSNKELYKDWALKPGQNSRDYKDSKTWWERRRLPLPFELQTEPGQSKGCLTEEKSQDGWPKKYSDTTGSDQGGKGLQGI